MEGKKLTMANCRELLAKLKTRREGAKKRVATRKKQGKPAELTTIEVLKKASDNLEKKVETEVNKDGKLQKTTITRSTKEVVDIVATIISGIPTKAERTEYINEVIADLKKLIDKVEPITEKMGMGGGIYSSEELYIVKVYDAKTGELLDMSKRVWAKNLTKAKENAIDDYEYDMQAKYGDYLRFSVEKAPSMFAKGGKIENQYAGRNAKDIWESWNEEQKVHFFTDHKQHPYYNNGNEKFVVSKNDREKYVGMNYEELPRMVKLMISDHVEDGQYAKGGEIGQELMGGQPNQEKPSGAILLEVRKNGKEIVVTEDDGKTKELYVKSNGFSGYTLHYKGNEYEFANSLDSYAKGGKITRNKNKNDYNSMFEFFVENNYQPIGKRDLINMAYESSNGIDSAIPQSMAGDVDNTAYYVYDYQTDKMGELVDLREKLKFSNVKVDVTIVQDDELKYGDDLPSELQNATFHQALNYVFKNDDVEKFAIRPKK
jgi:5-hydroxyisourate hydrolase-like protein (transthyretin family)